jgi:molecular chaperone DnaJ
LGDVFGFGDVFGGGRRRGGPQRGADLRYDLEISFDESAKGAETSIQIPRQEPCETCSGSGAAPGSKPSTCPQCQGRGQLRYQQGFFTVARTCGQCRGTGSIISKPCVTCRGAGRVQKDRKLTVRIPAGIATGQRLRLTGEGEGGTAGGPPGDLYVVIIVQEHPFFQRDGDDIEISVPIRIDEAGLGTKIEVPTIDGRALLKIPPGTQNGQKFRLREKGVPSATKEGTRGDEIVEIQVNVPMPRDERSKEILRELARLNPEDPRADLWKNV